MSEAGDVGVEPAYNARSRRARTSSIQGLQRDSLSYPCNLLNDAVKASRPALEARKQDIPGLLATLCVQNERDVDVGVREVAETGDLVATAASLDDVRNWFTTAFQLVRGSKPFFASTPSCRFIYFCAKHSRARLQVTAEMLLMVFTGYQVMPEYLEFLSAFGSQEDPKNSRFSAFFKQDFSKRPSYPCTLLGPGGRHIQMCYNLRGMTKKIIQDTAFANVEWSIRNAAVLHQLDLEEGRAMWIVTHGRRELLDRYDKLLAGSRQNMDERDGMFALRIGATLETHVMFCHWATEGWRPYLSWLEEMVADRAALATLAPRDPNLMPIQYTPQDIQTMHIWKDKVGEAILALQANINIMSALRDMYHVLSQSTEEPLRGHSEMLHDFVAEVDELVNNTKMQIPQAQLLLDTIVDHRELIAQHLHGQAAQKTEDLSTHLHREAIMMRIITIVTLTYLPATFVSTFFGTDVVKYQDENGGPPGRGRYSSEAMERWCQLAIPMTILTFLAAYLSFKSAQKVIIPNTQRLRQKHIGETGNGRLSFMWNIFSRERSSSECDEDDISLESFRGVVPPRTWSIAQASQRNGQV